MAKASTVLHILVIYFWHWSQVMHNQLIIQYLFTVVKMAYLLLFMEIYELITVISGFNSKLESLNTPQYMHLRETFSFICNEF